MRMKFGIPKHLVLKMQLNLLKIRNIVLVEIYYRDLLRVMTKKTEPFQTNYRQIEYPKFEMYIRKFLIITEHSGETS